MNPAAVAKARLVCDFPVEQILQIWFSSCISLEACRYRYLTFYASMISCWEEDNDICEVLQWWSKAYVRAEESAKEWSNGRSDAAYNNIPLLLREKDRVEYARYVLTGHIFLMVAPPFLTLLIRRRFSMSKLRLRAFFAPWILPGSLISRDLLSVTLGRFSSTLWRT